MSLDDQLRALCEEHDLICLHVGYTRYPGGKLTTYAMAQAFIDKQKADNSANRYCQFGDAGPTNSIKFALASAIEKINDDRRRVPVVSDLEAA